MATRTEWVCQVDEARARVWESGAVMSCVWDAGG